MSELEGTVLDSHSAEVDGDVRHPDDLSPEHDKDMSWKDEFEAMALATAESMVVDREVDEEITKENAEKYGPAFAEARDRIEAGVRKSRAKGYAEDKVLGMDGIYEIGIGRFFSSDLGKLLNEKLLTLEGYNYLFATYVAVLQEKPAYQERKRMVYIESGGKKYTSVIDAAAGNAVEEDDEDDA